MARERQHSHKIRLGGKSCHNKFFQIWRTQVQSQIEGCVAGLYFLLLEDHKGSESRMLGNKSFLSPDIRFGGTCEMKWFCCEENNCNEKDSRKFKCVFAVSGV